MQTMSRTAWTLVAFVALLSSLLVAAPQQAEALSGNEFNAGYIISDALFYDGQAMTEAQIQAFLVARGSGLRTYRSDVAPRPRQVSSTTGNVRCEAFAGGQALLASTIIYQAQSACGISAKVILVTLEKEQGLIHNPAPSEAALARAMGYACPDTAPCAPTTLGFGNQVYSGTIQLNTYKAAKFEMQPGVHAIAFHPNAACGSTNVNVLNYATAALYSYTPYQPNASALANLGGVGDACGSYGNRNFWVFYNNWFGSSTGPISPIGSVDIVSPAPGGIHIAGWVLDPDSAESIYLHAYVDGVGTAVLANRDRPDVGALYPKNGSAHGFDVVIPVPTGGSHNLCLYGINVGPGTHTTLLCTTAESYGGLPIGSYDMATGVAGGIFVGGWALDPDTASPIPVHVYVDQTRQVLIADQARSDIVVKYPALGAAHGFSGTIPATAGKHSVCAYAIDTVPEKHTLLGCRTATVPAPIIEQGRTPLGSLDAVVPTAGGIFVGGWALDPDTASSIAVHVYVDSVGVALSADQPRSDIGTIFSEYGSAHGFSSTVAATSGNHQVCVYAINTGPGVHNLLGCRTVVVPGTVPAAQADRSPIGSLDAVWATGTGFYVAGWAIDPDTTSSIYIHVYVDSVGFANMADQARADVAAAYPAYGGNHGVAVTVPSSPGAHQVCAYAINTGTGPHTLLGCRQVSR